MKRAKSQYRCGECGHQAPQWQGQCPGCGVWNSLAPYTPSGGGGRARSGGVERVRAQRLEEVSLKEQRRISGGSKEFDRVLGGGMVPGSAILLGGNPGAGKSTFLLQTLAHLAKKYDVLYLSAEESAEQIATRAVRLKLEAGAVRLLAETDLERCIEAAEEAQPVLLVVDSIQALEVRDLPSAAGSIAQVRECATRLIRFVKQSQTVLILVGHVTKEGQLAGPKTLEHLVDCSLLLEDSHDRGLRTLRTQKNRFGPTNELGVFAMTERGLREVPNPSAIFLSRVEQPLSGSLVMVLWEGSRPLLVEVQALSDESRHNPLRRLAVGIDPQRLDMLLAVLHRHGGQSIDQDIFVNIVGGVRVWETAADLALLLAISSSMHSSIPPRDLVVFGEVGLGGEVRPVPHGQERLREAQKHGFRSAIVPHANVARTPLPGIEIYGVRTVREALEGLAAR